MPCYYYPMMELDQAPEIWLWVQQASLNRFIMMFFTCNWPFSHITFFFFLLDLWLNPLDSIQSNVSESWKDQHLILSHCITNWSQLSDMKLPQPRICTAFLFTYQVSHKTGRQTQSSQWSKILAKLLGWQESLNMVRLPLASPLWGSHSCSTWLYSAPAKQVFLPPWGLLTNDHLHSVSEMETVSIMSIIELYPSNRFWDPKASVFS